MVAIAQPSLENHRETPWQGIAGQAAAWAKVHGVELRDAVVLVPFAEHVALARRAWARLGGWPPRIETTQTLARSIAPPVPADASQIGFDAALDRLTARRLMSAQSWGRAWHRRDTRGFEQAVDTVVCTAHAFARAAAAIVPAQRTAHWIRTRELLVVSTGPGGTERLLARVAAEWAAAGAAPITDALFELRPSAWIAVQAGGPDALVSSVLVNVPEVASLLIDADVPLDDPFSRWLPRAKVSVAVCADFEAEAQRAAAHVIAHLNEGRQPVALIAQDRLLVRRVRALLSRQRVPLFDETGWKLSTTRAGALVAALLRAAAARASADDMLDWLKSSVDAWPAAPDAARALRSIESAMRRAGWISPAAVDASRLPEAAAALWRAAQDITAELGATRLRSFSGWAAALRTALNACGALSKLQGDDAGRQVLAALHLLDAAELASEDKTDAMPFEEFVAWVDDALEDSSFIPEAPMPASDAPVVITPLARAMLRPFAAAVLAGADDKRLGASPSPHPLLGDALAAELGLPTASQHRAAETLAFAQLLRLPELTLLRRLDDGGEPLAPSPLLERLRLANLCAGRGELPVAANPLAVRAIASQPVPRPFPVAPALLPARLSASACEALRACPYRFFALRVLSLREADELDDIIEKRDYGTWLHAVLHRFHQERAEPLPAPQEETRLHEIAMAVQREMQLDEAAFLPFAASFVRFAPGYVQWLHERDAEGAMWLDGERELQAVPAEWEGTTMHGVVDRVDSVAGADGPVTQLIDYKTGSAQFLRQLVKQPQEDTQLAFYAALMAQQSQAPGDIAAIYLPLDDGEGIKPIEHKDVAATAQLLIDGIGHDLARLRQGAAMPALGEGRACEFCEARGLCRRDHWAQNEDNT